MRLRAEERGVVAGDAVERGPLLFGEDQSLGGGVVAVGSEVPNHGGMRIPDTLRLELLGDVVGGPAQVVGGVVGAQVGPMPDHGPVFVQTAGLKQLLARVMSAPVNNTWPEPVTTLSGTGMEAV
jgi:hypothetical protein